MLSDEKYEVVATLFDVGSEEYFKSVELYNQKYLDRDGQIIWYKRSEVQAHFNDLHAIWVMLRDEMFTANNTTYDEFEETLIYRLEKMDA